MAIRSLIFRLWAGLLACVLAGLALGACGGGQSASASAQRSASEVAQCLEAAGAHVEPLASGAEGELIRAQAPSGEAILIVNLSGPGMSKEAMPAFRKSLRESSGHGSISISSANDDSTLIGLVGIVGVNHATVSRETENLAKRCATSGRISVNPA